MEKTQNENSVKFEDLDWNEDIDCYWAYATVKRGDYLESIRVDVKRSRFWGIGWFQYTVRWDWEPILTGTAAEIVYFKAKRSVLAREAEKVKKRIEEFKSTFPQV